MTKKAHENEIKSVKEAFCFYTRYQKEYDIEIPIFV